MAQEARRPSGGVELIVRIFGREISIRKATPATASPVHSRAGWYPLIREWEPGAWQRNDEWTAESVLAHYAVYACITLISNDIGKLRHTLMQTDDKGISKEIQNPAYSALLRRPNRYQNHIQFKQWWAMSKLTTGNTYALKQRDARGVVSALYILDSRYVEPLVTPSGDIYYRLQVDNLAGLTQDDDLVVPASEIIHDRMNCLFHPLVGVSPLFASGRVADLALKIEKSSAGFFANGARPSGILTAPGAISEESATRLRDYWHENFTGKNAGRVAVVGDGLKFEQMRMTAAESQLIEQLKWGADVICATFHVPPYKIGLGQMPSYNNIESLQQEYYNNCLQMPIEEYELCLGEGIDLSLDLGIELDLSGLLRMDTKTQVEVLGESISKSLLTINEARAKINQPAVEGGDSIWMQQQDTSLAALAQRDRNGMPLLGQTTHPANNSSGEEEDEEVTDEELDEAIAA